MRFTTYLAIIKNSVGTRMFTEGYARIAGKPVNILANGEVGCAFYVTGVLALFDVKLISHTHTTMNSTIADMEKCGWQKVSSPQKGDIVVWGPKPKPDTDGLDHDHIGFYIGGGKAITNDFRRLAREEGGVPREIDWQYKGHPDGQREVVAIYRGRHLFEPEG